MEQTWNKQVQHGATTVRTGSTHHAYGKTSVLFWERCEAEPPSTIDRTASRCHIDRWLRDRHDLRHTWASLALAAGVHPKVVSERLGHSTISITLDTYSHAIPALEEEAAERVADLIG